MEIPIKCLMVLTMYFQIISNILDTANVWDHLSSYLLVLLRCRVYTNAHSRVSKQPIMCSKRGYVSRDLVALDLVKSQAKVYLWKHWPLPLRFSNTSSTFDIGICSRIIAWFVLRMSTYSLISPNALGFFTGLTLKVGPSTRSYIHVAMRSSNFAVTFYVSANWTRLGFWAIAVTSGSTCISACHH